MAGRHSATITSVDTLQSYRTDSILWRAALSNPGFEGRPYGVSATDHCLRAVDTRQTGRNRWSCIEVSRLLGGQMELSNGDTRH